MNDKRKQKYRDIQIGATTDSRTDLLQYLWKFSGIDSLEGLDVIEVGCGDGKFLDLLTKLNPKSLTGVDINPKYAENEQHDVFEAEQEDLPFTDASFDLYVSSETLEHSYDLEKSVSEMYRVLRPGGKILLGLPWGEKHSREPIHHSALDLGLANKTTRRALARLSNIRTDQIKHEIMDNGQFYEFRILITLK